MRNTRVLARHVLRFLRTGEEAPRELSEAIHELALAVWALAAEFEDLGHATELRRHVSRAAAHALATHDPAHNNLALTEIVGQVRSTAIDLLRASEAIASVSERPGDVRPRSFWFSSRIPGATHKKRRNAATCKHPRMEVVLVRHGETEWSRDLRHTGRTDIPLTEVGRREAEQLRAALASHNFARVLTSPLERAAETCRLAGLGDGAETTDALLEWDYGEYEGITTKEIRERRPGWFLWRDGCPGGETAAEVGARVDPLVDELAGLDGDVALFSHGHLLRVLTARWLGLVARVGRALRAGTGTLSILGFEREVRVIRRWNAPVTG